MCKLIAAHASRDPRCSARINPVQRFILATRVLEDMANDLTIGRTIKFVCSSTHLVRRALTLDFNQ